MIPDGRDLGTLDLLSMKMFDRRVYIYYIIRQEDFMGIKSEDKHRIFFDVLTKSDGQLKVVSSNLNIDKDTLQKLIESEVWDITASI